MSLFYSVIGFLLAIGILVTVHEFGHFWVARKLGVKVLRFSVGFGKPLYRRIFGEDRTEFVLAAIPLGGYVKMLGERDPDTPVATHETHRAFDNQAIWKRSLIVAAGPGINFLFAVLLFALIGWVGNDRLEPVLGDIPPASKLAEQGIQSGDRLLKIDGRHYQYFAQHDLYLFNQVLKKQPLELTVETKAGEIRSITVNTTDIPIYNINPQVVSRSIGLFAPLPPTTNILRRVFAGSPAALAGLKAGDQILAIDNKNINNWQDLVAYVRARPGQEIQIDYLRGEESLITIATPRAVGESDAQIGHLGVAPVFGDYPAEALVELDRGILDSFWYGAEQTWLMSAVSLRMLGKMITLQVSHKNINGPITIADVAGQAIQISLLSYLTLLALISIALGIMNLLPVPMLDGGHLMMYAVESVAGRDLAERLFVAAQPLGFVLLIGLMSLAFYNDIFRLLN